MTIPCLYIISTKNHIKKNEYKIISTGQNYDKLVVRIKKEENEEPIILYKIAVHNAHKVLRKIKYKLLTFYNTTFSLNWFIFDINELIELVNIIVNNEPCLKKTDPILLSDFSGLCLEKSHKRKLNDTYIVQKKIKPNDETNLLQSFSTISL